CLALLALPAAAGAQCGAQPGQDCTNANLSGQNLSGANLAGSIFVSANLSGTNLTNANLACAIFESSNLSGANLSGADLAGAVFDSATSLNGATASSSQAQGAILSGDLTNSNW